MSEKLFESLVLSYKNDLGVSPIEKLRAHKLSKSLKTFFTKYFFIMADYESN